MQGLGFLCLKLNFAKIWHVDDILPMALIGAAQPLRDLRDLLDLVHAGEQREPLHHLPENAGEGPHVDGVVVGAGPEELLGALVPTREPLEVELFGLVVRGAEVRDLDDPLLVDEDVLGLEVPVDDGLRVHVFQAQQDLVGDLLDYVRIDGVDQRFEERGEVVIGVFHDEGDGGVFDFVIEQFDDLIRLFTWVWSNFY